MASYTLQQLRDLVGYTCDVSIQATGRYPTTLIDQWLQTAAHNYALQRASYSPSADKRALLTGSASATVGASTFPANEVLQLPSDFLRLRAAFAFASGSRRQLQFLAESDRFDYLLPAIGEPTQCRLTTLEDGTNALRLWPACGSAVQFEIVYTPGAKTLTTSSPSGDWIYDAGCEDLLICEVALKLLGRDGWPEPGVKQSLEERMLMALKRLESKFEDGDSQGVATMRDTRSLNRRAYSGRRP